MLDALGERKDRTQRGRALGPGDGDRLAGQKANAGLEGGLVGLVEDFHDGDEEAVLQQGRPAQRGVGAQLAAGLGAGILASVFG